MRPLFVVCKVSPDPLCHRKNETAIVHVQSMTATNQLIVGVACERAIGFTTKVGLKSGSCISFRGGACSFDLILL